MFCFVFFRETTENGVGIPLVAISMSAEFVLYLIFGTIQYFTFEQSVVLEFLLGVAIDRNKKWKWIFIGLIGILVATSLEY